MATLADVAYTNLRHSGLGSMRANVAAAEACAVILKLAEARAALGSWPSQADYAKHWRISERSAQREWAKFRRGFPNETDPERLARWLYSEVSDRLDRTSVLTVTAPRDLVPV